MISESVLKFIRENIELIEDEKFEELYRLAHPLARKLYRTQQIGELTKVLLDSDINPLVGMTEIPYGFLAEVRNIDSFTIPNKITTIGKYSFSYSTISEIIIPPTVKKIERGAFMNTHIREILLSDVEILEEAAFYLCNKLVTVSFSTSLKELCDKSFGSCSNLQTINYTGTKEQWRKIQKEKDWNKSTQNIIVHCSNGDIQLSRR